MQARIRQRMGWIEASLRFSGRFGVAEKSGYMKHFGIATGQVSLDQAEFAVQFNESCGAAVVRHQKGKLALAAAASLPPQSVFDLPRMTEWLAAVMGAHFHKVESIKRAEPEPLIFRSVIHAIWSKSPLDIVYLSRSSGRSRKYVSPHVIVDAAERLHVRAYDHARGRFTDFVMSRILECASAGKAVNFVSNRQDAAWHRYEALAIKADPALEGDELMAVMRDFGLSAGGERLLKARAAVARYLADEPRGFPSPVSVVLLRAASEI